MIGRPIFGLIFRILLVAFALLGAHHFLRIATHPPPLSDLYPAWLGSRELLIRHRNPYSPAISREIQMDFYGEALGPGDHPEQQCCFAYPVYVSFLLAPSVIVNFPAVRLIALFLLAALTAIAVIAWSLVTGGRAGHLTYIVPLILLSPPVMQGLDLRQLALLVAALLAIAAFLAHHRRFALAGIALALATIKPQMSLLPIAWMLIWSLSDWRGRKALPIGFASTMALLVGAGEIVLRGWISSFLAQLSVYRHYAGEGMLEILYGREVGLGLTIFFVLALLFVMWREKSAVDFVPTLAIILAIEVPIMPGLKSLLNLVLLIPGIFILLKKYPVFRRDPAAEIQPTI